MNKYLLNEINSRVRANLNYIVNLYKLDESRLDGPKLKYNQMEILLWLNKFNSKHIDYKEIIKIKNLSLSFQNIKIIPKSIKLLSNLRFLDLTCNDISDISSLSSINLTHLYLHGNEISDISSLSNLINLTNLSLSSNKIVDISALSNLINLTNLRLMFNNISDISGLEQLINLKELALDSKIDIDKLQFININTKIYRL